MMFYRETNFQHSTIGRIPKEWEVDKLGSVVEIHDSKRIPLSEMERKDRKGPYPYCGANGIIDYINDYIFDGEFVLLAEDGGSYGKFESSAYVMSGKFWVNNHAHILRAIAGKTSNQFLKIVLDFLNLNPYIVGSTRKKLNQEQMREIKIPVPSLEEQRVVVGVLGVVDSAIELVDKVIVKTERLKKGLMQTLLTRGIGHKEYKQTPIGKIPKEWEVVSIYDVKANMKGAIVSGPFGSNIGKRFFVENGVPLIRGNNLTKGERLFVDEGFVFITEEKAEELKSCTALPDDLIFTAAGTLGQVGLIPENCRYPKYVISNKQLRARVDTNKALPLFLFYWFSTSIVNRLIKSKQTGTSIPLINLSILRSMPIPLPTIDEQQRISEILSIVDKRLEFERNEKTKLERIKRGLMDLLLTGKVRVKVD
jgi:type I restriction enzyme S subunit